MNRLAFLIFLLPLTAMAGDVEMTKLWFFGFESAFLNNDADTVDRWLSAKSRHIETVRFPGRRETTTQMTRGEVLASLRKRSQTNNRLYGDWDNIHLKYLGNGKACATRRTVSQKKLEGVEYEELLIRNVCFAPPSVVTEHRIDVVYTKK